MSEAGETVPSVITGLEHVVTPESWLQVGAVESCPLVHVMTPLPEIVNPLLQVAV